MDKLLTPQDLMNLVPGASYRQARKLMRKIGPICKINGEERITREAYANWLSTASGKKATTKKYKPMTKREASKKLAEMTPMQRALNKYKHLPVSQRYRLAKAAEEKESLDTQT